MVTLFGLGNTSGAVKRPADVMVPRVAFPPATPFTAQVTAVFEVPETAAVNCWVPPARTDCAAGVTLMMTADEPGLLPLLPPAQPERKDTAARNAKGMCRLRMAHSGKGFG